MSVTCVFVGALRITFRFVSMHDVCRFVLYEPSYIRISSVTAFPGADICVALQVGIVLYPLESGLTGDMTPGHHRSVPYPWHQEKKEEGIHATLKMLGQKFN